MKRIALLVNIPAPYRVPVYDLLAEQCGSSFRAIYMAARESNRRWNVPALRHDHVILQGITLPYKDREIHLRRGVLRELRAFCPDVVITGGFNPPMLAAWLYALAVRAAHVPMSDAWAHSEAGLSGLHRLIRRSVYRTSDAFVGASRKTLELFARDGASRNLFRAPLGVDNGAFGRLAGPLRERPFDVVFSGNLIDRKLPLFFAAVVNELAQRRHSVRALVIGDGPLREAMAAAIAASPKVQATFTGYLQQEELPATYARGKIFCFPTRCDPWGVVANEACAAGMPVITCAYAGCAGELVVDGVNGLVLPLDAAVWAQRIDALLEDRDGLATMGGAAHAAVQGYTFSAAADGILAACEAA